MTYAAIEYQDREINLEREPVLITHVNPEGLRWGEAPSQIPSPANVEETGLSNQLLEDLAIKYLYHFRRRTASELCDGVKLPFAVMEEVLEDLKSEGLITVSGAHGIGPTSYEYVLSDAGRERAIEAIARSPYYGPAPVPIEHYLQTVRGVMFARQFIPQEAITRLTDDLVLSQRLTRTLGPALTSGDPLFLYGPPGNGKTSLALAMGRAVSGLDPVFVPYLVEVEGQLMRVFDPAVHREIRECSSSCSLLLSDQLDGHDRRWVMIERPTVVVGGELKMEKLDPYFEASSGLYHAPIQMKANGGTLVIDDFGRQQMHPSELLNRWIIPLERHVDYVSLSTGQTFELPLQMVIIFATNLTPANLLDEAYLRRLPYKLLVDSPTTDQYRDIFERVCAKADVDFDKESFEYLVTQWYGRKAIPLRSAHPGALIKHVIDICRFRGDVPRLSNDLIDEACMLYFASDDA